MFIIKRVLCISSVVKLCFRKNICSKQSLFQKQFIVRHVVYT